MLIIIIIIIIYYAKAAKQHQNKKGTHTIQLKKKARLVFLKVFLSYC